MSAPLLNDYKRAFVYRRVLQTLIGGPRLALGCGVPCTLYLLQVIILVLPAALGCPLASLVDGEVIGATPAFLLYGFLLAAILILAQVLSYCLHGQTNALVQGNEGREAAAVEKASRLLAEDDEVDISQCCGADVWTFVVPLKKGAGSAVLQSFTAGCLGAAGLWALLPSYARKLYSEPTVSAMVLVLGWIVLCSAMYSLLATPPPEPAVYNAEEPWDLAPFSRPVHVFLCFLLMWLVHWCGEGAWKDAELAIYSVFLMCPLLWLIGFLPPLEALVLWSAEQILVFGFGGSPCASEWRLGLSLLLSLASVLVLWGCCINHPTWLFVMASISAYVLSTDLGGLISYLRPSATKRWSKYEAGDENGTQATMPNLLRRQLWGEMALHALQLLVTGVMVGCMATDLTAVSNQIRGNNSSESSEVVIVVEPREGKGNVLTAICFLFLLVLLMSNEFQKVYFFFGLLRNPLHTIKISPSVVRILRNIRGILVYRGLPLFLVFYIMQTVKEDTALQKAWLSNKHLLLLLNVMALWRFLRWSWQSPEQALLDVGLMWVMQGLIPGLTWTSQCVQLLLASFLADRIHQAAGKMYFAAALAVAAVLPGMSRRLLGFVLLGLNLALLPFPLAVVVVSTFVSAPLLPLFTLPLLLPSFPRPTRFWPASGCKVAVSSAPDSIYYQQSASKMTDALHRANESGSLGICATGSHYLLHFADRLVWVTILERGNGYCYYLLRGLELQETSCHAREAAGVEDSFSEAFEPGGSMVNRRCGHILTPLTQIGIETYSDAKATLTGLKMGIGKHTRLLAATMVWVLVMHWARAERERKRGTETPTLSMTPKKKKMAEEEDQEAREETDSHTAVEYTAKGNDISNVQNGDWISPSPSPKRRQIPHKRTIKMDHAGNYETQDIERTVTNGWFSPISPLSNTLNKQWTRADSPECTDVLGATVATKKGWLSPFSSPPLSPNRDFSSPPGIGFTSWIKPASKSEAVIGASVVNVPISTRRAMEGWLPLASPLAPPSDWIPPSWKLSERMVELPSRWFHTVVKEAIKVHDDITHESENELDALRASWRRIVNVCVCALVGSNKDSLLSWRKTADLFEAEVKDVRNNHLLPSSSASEWLMAHQELLLLALLAHRYATKLALDDAVMFQGEDDDNLEESSSLENRTEVELAEELLQLEHEWYLGREGGSGWAEAVLQEKPRLLSLSISESSTTSTSSSTSFSSRMLSLEQVNVSVGRLQREAVTGLWASLSMELLYLTNDDDERYSIQALPPLLRNLAVQAADPPLGYPLYSSSPLCRSSMLFMH